MRRLAFALWSLLGCHAAQPPTPAFVSATPVTPPRVGAPWLEVPLEIDAPTVAPVRMTGIELIDAVYGTALVVNAYGAFVIHDREGITGPYALGAIEDATFTVDRTLYVVRQDGSVVRAPYFAGKGLGPATQLTAIAGATGVFGGDKLLVVFTEAGLQVSVDGGGTFRALSFDAGEKVARAITRADDVLIVQTEGPRGLVTRISDDLGITFRESKPVPLLSRLGGLVYGVDRSCAFTPRYPRLSSSGVWIASIEAPQPSLEQRTQNLSRWFVSSTEGATASTDPPPWADDLVAPTTSAPVYGGYPQCDPPTGHLHPHRRVKAVKMLERAGDLPGEDPCSGVACLRGVRSARRPPTMTRAYLLHDGPRHALFVDDAVTSRETVRSIALPVGCDARFVTFSSGLVVLSCADSLHVATHDARWVEEWKGVSGRSPRADDFEMAEDGTAMFAHYDADEPWALVRAPSPLGGAPWRDVTRKGAIDYLVRDGGVVEVVLGDGDQLTVVADTPGTSPREVLKRIRLNGDLWCLGHKNDRFVGLRRNANGTFDRILLAPNELTLDGPALDGSGALDPTGACGF